MICHLKWKDTQDVCTNLLKWKKMHIRYAHLQSNIKLTNRPNENFNDWAIMSAPNSFILFVVLVYLMWTIWMMICRISDVEECDCDVQLQLYLILWLWAVDGYCLDIWYCPKSWYCASLLYYDHRFTNHQYLGSYVVLSFSYILKRQKFSMPSETGILIGGQANTAHLLVCYVDAHLFHHLYLYIVLPQQRQLCLRSGYPYFHTWISIIVIIF